LIDHRLVWKDSYSFGPKKVVVIQNKWCPIVWYSDQNQGNSNSKPRRLSIIHCKFIDLQTVWHRLWV